MDYVSLARVNSAFTKVLIELDLSEARRMNFL